jgi:nitrogen fixation protein FixH
MKLKLNWGVGILIVILLFFGTIVIRLIIAYNQKIELVENDYYLNQIQHQQMIDKKQNAVQLGLEIKAIIEDNGVLILYPDTFKYFEIKGTIKIYRPSDNRQDHDITILPDSNSSQLIKASLLTKGKYILRFDYLFNEMPVYQETEIIFHDDH